MTTQLFKSDFLNIIKWMAYDDPYRWYDRYAYMVQLHRDEQFAEFDASACTIMKSTQDERVKPYFQSLVNLHDPLYKDSDEALSRSYVVITNEELNSVFSRVFREELRRLSLPCYK